MRVRVRFRVNAETGEVEEFLITDIGTMTDDEKDHDAVHDAIAYEVGKVVERRPAPEQVVGGAAADAVPLTYRPDADFAAAGESDREREEAKE
jgi:hypothetical protein